MSKEKRIHQNKPNKTSYISASSEAKLTSSYYSFFSPVSVIKNLSNSAIAITKSIRGSSTSFPAFVFLNILNLVNGLHSANRFDFSHEGVYYEFKKTYTGQGKLSELADFAYQNMTALLQNATCGEVIPSRLAPTQLVQIWKEAICTSNFEFSFDDVGENQTIFQNCVMDYILNPIAKEQNEICYDIRHDRNITAVIALSSVIGGLALMVISAMALCYCCQKRNAYQAIPDPEQESVRQFITDAHIVNSSVTNAHSDIDVNVPTRM